MSIQPNTQKYISPFVASQFPRFYEEFGPVFIRFVEAYYEWSETTGPLHDSRNIDEYLDIDTTIEEFLVYFKDKYLQNIQLPTTSNVKLLVKHSLDIYRSRGTIRCIDLLFRLVFGTGATVYYPWDDTFRLSAGEWKVPQYIEVSSRDDLNKFVGKEIIGTTTGATAFVESWVRKKKFSKQIDILYISARRGEFRTDEFINTTTNPFNTVDCPTMVGSLNEILIDVSTTGTTIGDQLRVKGSDGYGAKAVISSVVNKSGLVSFDLVDGGYGYTSNAQVLISDQILFLRSVQTGNNITDGGMFQLFETISQSTANIVYGAASGNFQNNDLIFAYTNNVVTGSGLVLSQTTTNSTAGEIQIYVSNGSFTANTLIYNSANAISANLAAYSNTTATANVIAESLNFQADVDTIQGTFFTGENITQNNSTAKLNYISVNESIGTFYGLDRIGPWYPNMRMTGDASGANANITNIIMNIGVVDSNNAFIADARAPLKTGVSGTTAILERTSLGASATVAIANNLLYGETVRLNVDYLNDYANVGLGATSYGLPANTSANVSSYMADALTYSNLNIGRISSIISFPGADYNAAPFVRVFEPNIFYSKVVAIGDLRLINGSPIFAVNEIITQESSNAIGMVISTTNNVLTYRKLSYNNKFSTTIDANSVILGTSSGKTANVDYVFAATTKKYPTNLGGKYMGMNSLIDSDVVVSNGTISGVKVTISGWGFSNGEPLTLTNSAGTVVATGRAILQTQGKGAGYYRTKDGFLSDIKKLQDSDYYQVSSYEVRSSVTFDRYADMLKQILHVAGTKAFGAFYYTSRASLDTDIQPLVIKKTVYTTNNAVHAFGNSVAVAYSTYTMGVIAQATSNSQALAIGKYTFSAVGSVSASASSDAKGISTAAAAGNSASTSIVFGFTDPGDTAMARASGTAEANGVGSSIAEAPAISNGVATLTGISG